MTTRSSNDFPAVRRQGYGGQIVAAATALRLRRSLTTTARVYNLNTCSATMPIEDSAQGRSIKALTRPEKATDEWL